MTFMVLFASNTYATEQVGLTSSTVSAVNPSMESVELVSAFVEFGKRGGVATALTVPDNKRFVLTNLQGDSEKRWSLSENDTIKSKFTLGGFYHGQNGSRYLHAINYQSGISFAPRTKVNISIEGEGYITISGYLH